MSRLQPALVYTYCAGRSPHDQYYFKHPNRMVAGAVAPPRIDRWRELYRSAVRQREIHHKILGDHSRPEVERNHSRRLRAQAESQIRLLTEAEGA